MKLWVGLLALCLVLTGCSGHAEEKQRRSFFAMDTYMTMTACGPEAEAGLKSAEARIRQIESELSVTDPGSEVYRVNHGSGTDIPVGKIWRKLSVRRWRWLRRPAARWTRPCILWWKRGASPESGSRCRPMRRCVRPWPAPAGSDLAV